MDLARDLVGIFRSAGSRLARFHTHAKQRIISETNSWVEEVKKVVADRAYSLNYEDRDTVSVHAREVCGRVPPPAEGGTLWHEQYHSVDKLEADGQALPAFVRRYFVGWASASASVPDAEAGVNPT